MLVLVTGGEGFVGSHVVDALRDAGHEARVIDLRSGGDLRDPEAVLQALDGVDHVCHQAGMVGLGVDVLDLADYVSHNDLGTAVLLRALAQRRFRGRLVLASSMVVYGEGMYRCAAHGTMRPAPRHEADLQAGRFEPRCPRCDGELAPEAIPEHAPTDPRNVYAATKLHQEHLAFTFGRETGVPVTALRYHNVYGPRMARDTPYAGVAAIFSSALRAGNAPRVFEDGRQMRDFVHVRDVARSNLLALLAPEPITGAFNVCSGTPRGVLDVALALRAAHGDDAPDVEVTGDYRLGDVRHVFASPDQAAEWLGFTAREDFAAGMAELASGPATAATIGR
jgi:dTDP-L-rhamnose 4-epimerase